MVRPSFASEMREQFLKLPLVTADLTGKTIIIVGTSAGLGYEATRHIIKMNPGKLILANRSLGKANTALQGNFKYLCPCTPILTFTSFVPEIRQATGCKGGEVWSLDLSNFASIKAFVANSNVKEVVDWTSSSRMLL